MAQGSETWYDAESGAVIINETEVPMGEIFTALDTQNPEVASLVRWGSSMKPVSRHGSIFERDRYITPDAIFDQFRTALDASENDDVVSGVVESTEALAFNKVDYVCEDEQEEDVWNQIIDSFDLDSILRQMWRETFIVSQFYAGVIWGKKSFKVRKKTPAGNKSKKTFDNLNVPLGITIFDPMRIVPVGNTFFGQDKLAYIADRSEATQFDDTLARKNTSDQVVNSFIASKYEATRDEKLLIAETTGTSKLDNLYLLNEENVFKHTATKPDYQRYASVRMKSVFELLDLKHQLRQMDRAYLIGGTNFIILVKKGSTDQPAKQSEVNDLATQIKGTSRVPVIIGDHRIEIEIITPDIDMTLKPERYNVLDARITARLYQMFMTGNYAAGASGDDSLKLSRVVATGMESRRMMILKTLEKKVFKPIYEKNTQLTDPGCLNFHPKRIALGFDNNVAVFLQDLRDRGDVSRDTILSELNLDQGQEAIKREREAEQYDDIFVPTNVPFSGSISVKEDSTGDPRAKHGKDAPAAAPKAATAPANTKGPGRRGGGATGGGGNNRKSGTSQPGRGTVPQSKVKNPGKAS